MDFAPPTALGSSVVQVAVSGAGGLGGWRWAMYHTPPMTAAVRRRVIPPTMLESFRIRLAYPARLQIG
jgi:hypothetical protein